MSWKNMCFAPSTVIAAVREELLAIIAFAGVGKGRRVVIEVAVGVIVRVVLPWDMGVEELLLRLIVTPIVTAMTATISSTASRIMI